MQANIQCRRQGMSALEVFSLVLGDANYATAYNMSVSSASGMVTKTSKPLTYVMTIPAEFQYPGRQFSLIQLGKGVVNILHGILGPYHNIGNTIPGAFVL